MQELESVYAQIEHLDGWENIGTLMSNFDREVDKVVEEKLRAGNYYASYPAWDFYGFVWFDQKKQEFACEIDRYGVALDVIRGASPEEILLKASEKYGWK